MLYSQPWPRCSSSASTPHSTASTAASPNSVQIRAMSWRVIARAKLKPAGLKMRLGARGAPAQPPSDGLAKDPAWVSCTATAPPSLCTAADSAVSPARAGSAIWSCVPKDLPSGETAA